MRHQLTPRGKAALKYCQEHRDMNTNQLSKLLCENEPALFPGAQIARSLIRYYRGLKGMHSRIHTDHGVRIKPLPVGGVVRERGRMVLEYLKKYPLRSTASLAKIILEEHPEMGKNFETVRTAVRYFRGLCGPRNRMQARDYGFYIIPKGGLESNGYHQNGTNRKGCK